MSKIAPLLLLDNDWADRTEPRIRKETGQLRAFVSVHMPLKSAGNNYIAIGIDNDQWLVDTVTDASGEAGTNVDVKATDENIYSPLIILQHR